MKLKNRHNSCVAARNRTHTITHLKIKLKLIMLQKRSKNPDIYTELHNKLHLRFKIRIFHIMCFINDPAEFCLSFDFL